MTAEELRNRHMRTLFDKEQCKSPSLGGVIVMCKTVKKLQSSETSGARFRAGAVGGCPGVGAKRKSRCIYLLDSRTLVT